MYLQSLDDDTIIRVENEEQAATLIRAEKHINAEPDIMSKQLFGYMSDNDDTQLKCDIEDFLAAPKRFVQHYLCEILELNLLMDSYEKYLYLHHIEGILHSELMKRNLIKRAWVPNV